MAAPLIPGMGSLDWSGSIGQIIYWGGIVFLALGILIIFFAAYYILGFKIKATVIPMYGSGKDGVFSVGKPKKNRIKWIENRTAWKSLFPLFNKKSREPFDTEFVYPGNQVYIYELNDEWVPGRINVNKTEDEIRAEINPVPYYVRNWQSLTYQKHEIEFAKQDFWTENKQLFITLGVIAFNLILCGAVIYFTFKYAGGQGVKMDALTNAIKGIGNIAGQAPR